MDGLHYIPGYWYWRSFPTLANTCSTLQEKLHSSLSKTILKIIVKILQTLIVIFSCPDNLLWLWLKSIFRFFVKSTIKRFCIYYCILLGTSVIIMTCQFKDFFLFHQPSISCNFAMESLSVRVFKNYPFYLLHACACANFTNNYSSFTRKNKITKVWALWNCMVIIVSWMIFCVDIRLKAAHSE